MKASTFTLQELAVEIRKINAANGWAPDFQFDDIPNMLALVHSEVSEAWTAGNDMPAAQRELGDIIVRALDLCELVMPGRIREDSYILNARRPLVLAPRWLPLARWYPVRAIQLMQINAVVTEALQAYRKAKPEEARMRIITCLVAVVAQCAYLMAAWYPERSFHDTLDDILTKNRQRGFRHGGLRS